MSVADIRKVPAKLVPVGGERVSVIEALFATERVPGVGEMVAHAGKVFDEKTNFCAVSASAAL